MKRNLVRIFVIFAFGMLGMLLSTQLDLYAQDDAPDFSAVTTTNETAQSCAECHIDVVLDWQNSTHAQAYEDADFQHAWQSLGTDPECLACHTTGYSPRNQTFQHEGVTCEACHGQTPADHPEEPISSQPDVDVCADCHVTTFNEWQKSGHGEADMACSVCHSAHPQQLRATTEKQLCLDCHADELPQSYAHVTHEESNCADCHWHHSIEDDADHIVTGNLLYTGHDGAVETKACVDCHTDESEIYARASEELLASDTQVLDAQVKIDELEAEVEQVRAQGENQAAVQLIQGLLAGFAVGAVLVIGTARFRK